MKHIIIIKTGECFRAPTKYSACLKKTTSLSALTRQFRIAYLLCTVGHLHCIRDSITIARSQLPIQSFMFSDVFMTSTTLDSCTCTG